MYEMMELMNSTDVLIGVHGAGWTNALFLKPGGAALQLHPYGWQESYRKSPIRGGTYRTITLAKGCLYKEWVNPFATHAFMKAHDFKMMEKHGDELEYEYDIHPQPDWDRPTNSHAGNHWIYQNTLVDIENIAPMLDELMEYTGARPRAMRTTRG